MIAERCRQKGKVTNMQQEIFVTSKKLKKILWLKMSDTQTKGNAELKNSGNGRREKSPQQTKSTENTVECQKQVQ